MPKGCVGSHFAPLVTKKQGLTYDGKVTCEPVAKELGYAYVDPKTLL